MPEPAIAEPVEGSQHFLYTFDYADPELRSAHRSAHLDYMRSLADAGGVVMAGPLSSGAGALVIFRATSTQMVERWIAEDPYAQAGVPCNQRILGWQVVIDGRES